MSIKKIAAPIIGVLMVCCIFLFFLIFTTSGNTFLIKQAVSRYLNAEVVTFQNATGNIIPGMTLENIIIKNFRDLPEETSITIDRIDIWLAEFNISGPRVVIEGGKLLFPSIGNITFRGRLEGQDINIEANSDLVDLNKLFNVIAQGSQPEDVTGYLSDVNLEIAGKLSEPTIESTFRANNIVYDEYVFYESLCRLRAAVISPFKNPFVKGTLSIDNLRMWPRHITDSEANIQNTVIDIDTQEPTLMGIKIFNGRFSMPGSEPVLFQGNFKAGHMNMNIYMRRMPLDILVRLLDHEGVIPPVNGIVEDVDIYLSGAVQEEPSIKGTALIEELRYQNFYITKGAISYNLTLTDITENIRVHGTVDINEAVIRGSGTAVIDVGESKLSFYGDPERPVLDIKGRSTVDNVNIKLVLRGTAENPEISLSSSPSLPQERLVIMLATNRKWSGMDALFSEGKIQADLAIDLIDYFILGGEKNKLRERFGITDLSITADDSAKGAKITKSLHEQVDLGYGIRKPRSEAEDQDIKHSLSADVRVSESLSVTAETDIKKTPSDKSSQDKRLTDNVLLKLRKEF